MQKKVISRLVGGSKGKYAAITISGESESDDELQKSGAKEILKAINRIHQEIVKMQYPQLYKSICDAFRCSICLTMKPPIVYSKCCLRIVGCEGCVARSHEVTWQCPLCRKAIVGQDSISRVRCLDEMLIQLAASDSDRNGTSSHPYHVASPEPAIDSDDDFQ